ncbi:MAG TPA: HAD-IIB family hydrolase [Candidatus Paceibacterota bacterium]|nr:HAD-IIB family hydrolase [Candidatus Paceibacterota bacterium]HRZ34443.1 HAD-IIB family hydrolase [Candidatus Paceibacterota bacterium]
MPFKYKIAAFDLDGTIAESKRPLSQEMVGRLFELASKIRVVIISGASITQFQKQVLTPWHEVTGNQKGELIKKINQNLILLPVCGTQQYFYDEELADWKIVHSDDFEDDIKDKVISVVNSIVSDARFDIAKNPAGPYIEDRGTQITFSALGQSADFAVKQTWDKDGKKKKIIRDELAKLLPEVEVRVGGTTSIDILPKGFDKAVGLLRLLFSLGMTKEDMIFAGDAIFPGGNDEPVEKSGMICVKVDDLADTIGVIDSWLEQMKNG